MNWFKKIISKEKKEDLGKKIEKPKKFLLTRLSSFFLKKSKIDTQTIDQLEEILIGSDIGVDTSSKIIEGLQKKIKKEKYNQTSELQEILHEEILSILIKNKSKEKLEVTSKKPYVIMVVGINGVGKTTTVGKLAHKFKNQKLKVMLGAGDTFRAAAIEQLTSWAEKIEVPIVKQKIGADPASVAFDCLQSAKSKEIDVVLIDTAGRLHNKIHLMEELSRIKRAMGKVIAEAPHEVMLILDGSTGQNAFEQVKKFAASTNLNSLAITKLDGTAKGGVLIGIADQFDIPIKYIGLGEKIEDLQDFKAKEFVDSIVGTL